MRYRLDETWADIRSTVSCLGSRRNAVRPMVFELQSLLDLRCEAESTAKRAVELATASLQREQEEQARLAAHWNAAGTSLEREARRLAKARVASTAEQGVARESYLGRLRQEANRLKCVADNHAATALATAKASHEEALSRYGVALREREALSQLEERAQTAARKIASRRAEDAATDLANSRRRR